MSIKPPPGLKEGDFDEIEEAVMETARGRWFLREYSRRARAADTDRLLDALGRIEKVISGQASLAGGFTQEPHARALEERQNRIAEIGWTLRERGYDSSICTLIENEARALARLAELMREGGLIVEGALSQPALAPLAPPIETVAPKPVEITQAPAATPPSEPTITAPPAPESADAARARRLAALDSIERMTQVQKIALFA